MLPIFNASGHFAYPKGAQFYLQDMSNLELTMEYEEYRQFTEDRFFTIRRSDKAWSGVWSDMLIEQTLNMYEVLRGVWLLTIYWQCHPFLTSCLGNYANLEPYSSEQHVDLSKSGINKDNDDIEKLEFWFKEHNAFPSDCPLMSLSTGIIGGPEINCHQAFERGKLVMEKIIGHNFAKVRLSAIYKVKPLALAHIIDEHFINVDFSGLHLF